MKGNLIFHVLYRSDMEEHKLDCLRGQIPFEETISMDGVNELGSGGRHSRTGRH